MVADADITAGETASALLVVLAGLQTALGVVDGMTCVAVGAGDAVDAGREFIDPTQAAIADGVGFFALGVGEDASVVVLAAVVP